MQEYVAEAPKVVIVALTLPLVGAVSAPQSFGTQVGATALHVPSAWHVTAAMPESV